jgi:hypothetical protein
VKVTINAEFTDDELKKHAADVGRRWAMSFFGEAYKTGKRLKIPPGALAGIREALANAFGKKSQDDGPIAWSPSDPLPKDPNVSVPDFAAEDDRCLRIESSSINEEGWACCHCPASNGVQRAACRVCGHVRCDIVVPPPPPPRRTDPFVQ